jgi:hypothetical protein
MPRHVTIGEIGKMVEEVPDLETTVFILNIRCANIDGFCTFNHFPLRCPEPEKLLGKERIEAFRISNPDFLSKDPIWTNACMLPYSISILYWNQEEAKREAACRKQSLWDRFHIDDIPCGACALYEFDEMDVTSAKIVGRGKPTEIKIRDIKFIRLLLDFLRSQRPSKEEFRETARRLHMYVYKAPCLTTTCYYPEVLSKEEVLL